MLRRRWFVAACVVLGCDGGSEPAGPSDDAAADALDASSVADSIASDSATPTDGAMEVAPPIVSGMLEKKYTAPLGVFIRTPLSPVPKGMVGTDLGVAFPLGSKIVLLFGDNWEQNDDSIAFAEIAYPKSGLPPVSWVTTSTGAFLPLRAGTTDLGPMNVPVEGVVVGDRTYVFFVTGFDAGHYGASVLAHATAGDFAHLTVDFTVPSAKFVNVSVVQEGTTAWIFGSGAQYRKSPIHLAKVDVSAIADRSKWQFFAAGKFVASEAEATPIVEDPCVGELSVRRHPRLGLYLMAYNCDAPRGILLRTATSPTGPRSTAIDVMDASGNDGGYGRVMHQKPSVVGYDDGLSESLARVEEWGGEYGPYLVPEWFDALDTPPGTFPVVYTMSSWNPYTVSLMRTVLGAPGVVATPPKKGEGLPKAKLVNGDFATGDTSGWTQTGDPFAVFVGADGLHRVTSFTPSKSDAAIGQLSQTFVVDGSTSKLTFLIHGGDARVKLMRGAEVLRTSWGHRDNVDSKVAWSLVDYRGDELRVVIDDSLTTAWGFVGATSFVLE